MSPFSYYSFLTIPGNYFFGLTLKKDKNKKTALKRVFSLSNVVINITGISGMLT